MPHTYRRVDDLEYDILKPDGEVEVNIIGDESTAKLVVAMYAVEDSATKLIANLQKLVEVQQAQIDTQKRMIEAGETLGRLRKMSATIPGAN